MTPTQKTRAHHVPKKLINIVSFLKRNILILWNQGYPQKIRLKWNDLAIKRFNSNFCFYLVFKWHIRRFGWSLWGNPECKKKVWLNSVCTVLSEVSFLCKIILQILKDNEILYKFHSVPMRFFNDKVMAGKIYSVIQYT